MGDHFRARWLSRYVTSHPVYLIPVLGGHTLHCSDPISTSSWHKPRVIEMESFVCVIQKELYVFYVTKLDKKHLKNVGPICHCEPPHAACSNFTLPFTRCRYCRTPCHGNVKLMSTTTTRDRGDCYGPMEWAQLCGTQRLQGGLSSPGLPLSLLSTLFTGPTHCGCRS